jgi:hypothetical protein
LLENYWKKMVYESGHAISGGNRMQTLMEKFTAPTSAQNRPKRPIVTNGSRAKVICLGTLCLAVGIANSLALTDT